MSTPPDHPQSLLAKPLSLAVRIALRWPAMTILLAVGFAALSAAWSGTRLKFFTSRTDLVSPDAEYHARWLKYAAEFGEQDDAIIAVQARDQDALTGALDKISEALSKQPDYFRNVLGMLDFDALREKGLYFLSTEQLTALRGLVIESRQFIEMSNESSDLTQVLLESAVQLHHAASERNQDAAQSALQRMGWIAGALAAAVEGNADIPTPLGEAIAQMAKNNLQSSEQMGDQDYLLTDDGQFGFVLLHLVPDTEGFTRYQTATTRLRQQIARIQREVPGTKIRLTGIPVMEFDEMRDSQSSMTVASIVSMVAVAILFVAGFGGVRHAALATAVLLLAISWTFGYATLTVGHLNILSMSFTVTLIGIGIDYGIYYVSRYVQLRREGAGCLDALHETADSVGPAILSGALTTAIAFFSAGLTSFTGVAELGIIAGGGILLCAVAELLVLPAAIYLVDESPFGKSYPKPLPIHQWLIPVNDSPRRILVTSVVLSALLALGLSSVDYDQNLLNLQNDSLDSVALERELLSRTRNSSWYAVSVAKDTQELLQRKEALLRLESVERVEEVVSRLPRLTPDKLRAFDNLRRELDETPDRPQRQDSSAAAELDETIRQTIAILESIPGAEAPKEVIQYAWSKLQAIPQRDRDRIHNSVQEHLVRQVKSAWNRLRNYTDVEPPSYDDLPQDLAARFIGKRGSLLLKIYGRGEIWDQDTLAKFIDEVRSVDPEATGNPFQAHEATAEMKHSYERAAMMALIVIVFVLYLDLRSVPYTLLAICPLAVGMLQMLGILGLVGIPLNPANMIALPILLGIGVDYGVHVIHEFRGRSRWRYRVSEATAVAVLIDSLTTIVGFGALMLATHRGLQSLGRVLVIGTTTCLFCSLILLPTALAWITSGKEPEGDVATQSTENPDQDSPVSAAA